MWNFSGNYKERFGSLLTSAFCSDLKIIVSPQNKEEVEIKAHKIFLQAGSRVLNDKIRQDGDQLVFLDVEPAIVKLMLKYFYTGKSDVDLTQALRLLQLATEYEIKELIEECEHSLIGKITEENVLALFEEGMLYGHNPTIKRTLNFICRNGPEILKRFDFARLRLECLIEIIKQDELVVENEMEVFDAVFGWGVAECIRQSLDPNDPSTMRTILAKAVKYIRFPLMNSEEFALKVATKNLLAMEEQMALLMTFLVPFGQRSSLPEGRFISTPRKKLNAVAASVSADSKQSLELEEYFSAPGACALNKNPIVDKEFPIHYVSRRGGAAINFKPLDFKDFHPSGKSFGEKIRLKSNQTYLLEGLRFPSQIFKILDNIDIRLLVDLTLVGLNGEPYIDGEFTFENSLSKKGDWLEFFFKKPSLWIYVGERVDIKLRFIGGGLGFDKFFVGCDSKIKVGGGYGDKGRIPWFKGQVGGPSKVVFEFLRPEESEMEISKGFMEGIIVSF